MDKRVLLIADDEEMNRRIIKTFLHDSFEILEAEDGVATLELLDSTPVDALLLDIIMPQLDGLEVLKQVRGSKKFDHLGILVATSTKEKTERAALSLGADDIVAKPYDPLVIQKRLNNILDVKELEVQKNLLLNAEYERLVNQGMKENYKQVEQVAKQIQKYTAILNANKDNFSLVAEITEEINKETEKLLKVFA